MEDLKNIQHFHRGQVKSTDRRCLKINFIFPQKVKITIENSEELEITESCGENKKKDNPFSQDSAFLAVSLIQILKYFTRMLNGLAALLLGTFDKVAMY